MLCQFEHKWAICGLWFWTLLGFDLFLSGCIYKIKAFLGGNVIEFEIFKSIVVLADLGIMYKLLLLFASQILMCKNDCFHQISPSQDTFYITILSSQSFIYTVFIYTFSCYARDFKLKKGKKNLFSFLSSILKILLILQCRTFSCDILVHDIMYVA